MNERFEDFLRWTAGYENTDGAWRSCEDNSALTDERRARLEEICFRPTERFVRVTREATPDFPASLPNSGEYSTDYRLIAVLSVDHNPITQGTAVADVWAAAGIAELHGGRLALYARDFSSPALRYTHFDLLAAPDKTGARQKESLDAFTNGAVFNDPEAQNFATPEDEERMLRAVAVEMAMRVDGILAASDKFAAKNG